jgi:membrane associated rhomboid family serine protease
MIFPILAGVHGLLRAPVTWALLILNLLVFTVTYHDSEVSQAALENYMHDQTFSETQGVVFAKFIQGHPERYPASLENLATQSQAPLQSERRELLGGLSMRDSLFLNDAQKMPTPLDEVANKWWLEKFSELQVIRDIHPSYALGLTQSSQNFLSIITYQFTHSGFSHILGNMLFFLIFSSTLETMIGGLAVLVLYLTCGIFAALSFLLMSEASAVPLIGASGAISGLMAFFCVLMWRTKVRYAYFLFLPRRDFAGIVNLPAWITLVLWFLSDLAGHWSTPTELGGIAYSAHLGGEACGIIAALLFIAIRKARGVPLPTGQIAVATKFETVHSALLGQSS